MSRGQFQTDIRHGTNKPSFNLETTRNLFCNLTIRINKCSWCLSRGFLFYRYSRSLSVWNFFSCRLDTADEGYCGRCSGTPWFKDICLYTGKSHEVDLARLVGIFESTVVGHVLTNQADFVRWQNRTPSSFSWVSCVFLILKSSLIAFLKRRSL